MGGISTSTLRFIPNATYASWSGVCRTDGGGFCGMRTLPFVEPLQVVTSSEVMMKGGGDGGVDGRGGGGEEEGQKIQAKGLYIKCRLYSDNEPERRVWKMTLRTDTSRGELVYQSQFQLPKLETSPFLSLSSPKEEDGQAKSWSTIQVPFDNFVQVRGPRVVPNGLELDLSKGLYQIGMTMSKFQLGLNTTEIQDFRAGYFDLQIQQIGLYYHHDYADHGNDDNDNDNGKETKTTNNNNNNNNNDKVEIGSSSITGTSLKIKLINHIVHREVML